MRISKKLTATLIALGVVGVGVMAHAAPPVGKTVLQTYSCKRVNNCYTGIGTGKTGWIAAHDDLIRLYEIRSDGWVKGDYPAGSGRVTRWFKFGDLVMNGNFQNYEANLVNAKTLSVYRTYSSGSSFGTVYNTDKVIVVDEYGSRKCIVYNLDAGGYKMGWVDKNKVTSMSRVTNITTSNPMINTSSGVRTNVSSKEQQEVAKRYVNAYEDVNLTKIKSGSYIDYNETYWVQKVQGNALYVRYKSNSGQDRYAWVSVDVRKELNLDYIWPVDGCYGLNTIYKYSDSSVHSCRFKVNGIACGVDIDAVTNTPVKAVADGRVIEKKFQQYYENGVKKGFGNYLVIEHSGGVKTLYAHMQRYGNGISVNAYVRKGQIIGYVGSTGGSTGPHLHYELSIMNPYEYYGNKLPLKANNCRTDK